MSHPIVFGPWEEDDDEEQEDPVEMVEVRP
jgi:hypothetical protein